MSTISPDDGPQAPKVIIRRKLRPAYLVTLRNVSCMGTHIVTCLYDSIRKAEADAAERGWSIQSVLPCRR